MLGGQAIRTVAPTSYPLSLPEVKAHLRITAADEDALLAGYIAAATQSIEQYTGLGLMLQTWTQTFPAFAARMDLARRPLLSAGSPETVAAVSYLDSAGASQTLDPALYRVTGVGSDQVPGAIRLAYGASWPAAYADEEAVTVTYTVGYGITPSSVPEIIRQAIMQTVGDWYAFRENVSADFGRASAVRSPGVAA